MPLSMVHAVHACRCSYCPHACPWQGFRHRGRPSLPLELACWAGEQGACAQACAGVQVQTQLANHIAAIGPAVVIGALCGLLAIVFTTVNLRLARLRQRLLQARRAMPMRKCSSWTRCCRT